MGRIYTNSITNAVFTIISSWNAAANSNWTIQQNEEFNTESNIVPWVCVYSPFIVFDPFRANINNPFMATYQIPIITQCGNFDDHRQAILDVEDLRGEMETAVSCFRECAGKPDTVQQPENKRYDPRSALGDAPLAMMAMHNFRGDKHDASQPHDKKEQIVNDPSVLRYVFR